MDSDQAPKQESPQPFNADRIDFAETIGGSHTRKYLNQHVTPALLEGMRLVAKNKPSDPLRYLGEYLIKASQDQSQHTHSGSQPNDSTSQN
ncbi:LAQU0S11e03796g1_1 [Lachancea quebecensis]|uniref:LAQU0S11e03796g1_1 n=1 Tax=Lachancea quebecensis TaxID=1654605 RepID=A0A0P1KU59_9SACH|nr:LAQU0S11e03796g1_1 [Lachancea quebecensis]